MINNDISKTLLDTAQFSIIKNRNKKIVVGNIGKM